MGEYYIYTFSPKSFFLCLSILAPIINFSNRLRYLSSFESVYCKQFLLSPSLHLHKSSRITFALFAHVSSLYFVKKKIIMWKSPSSSVQFSFFSIKIIVEESSFPSHSCTRTLLRIAVWRYQYSRSTFILYTIADDTNDTQNYKLKRDSEGYCACQNFASRVGRVSLTGAKVA